MNIKELLENEKGFSEDKILDAIENCIAATVDHDTGAGDGDTLFDEMEDAQTDLRNELSLAVEHGLTKQDVMRVIMLAIKDIADTPAQKNAFSDILDSVIVDELPENLAPTKAELKVIQKSTYTPADHKQHLQGRVSNAREALANATADHARAVADLNAHLEKHPHLKD